MIDKLTEFIYEWVDLPYLCIFILLTYSIGDIVKMQVYAITGKMMRKRYTVFVVATFVAIVYWLLLALNNELVIDWNLPVKLLVTYAIGTALYGHIIDYVLSLFKRK